MKAAALALVFASAGCAVAEQLEAYPYGHEFNEIAECNAEYTVAAKKLCDLGVEEYCPKKVVEEEAVKKGPFSKEEGTPDHVDSQQEYRAPDGWDHRKHGDDWKCPKDSQSPVDIQRDVDLQGQSKYVLWFDFKAPVLEATSEAQVVNDGHSIFLDAGDMKLGDVKLGGQLFHVRRSDFRSPSEHTVDGEQFPLELQVFHTNDKGDKVMVSVMFRESKTSNVYLAALKKAVPTMPVWTVEKGDAQSKVNGAEHSTLFDLENALPMAEIHPGGDMTFYNYVGSLTVPPCEGGVDWWVIQKPLMATKEEIEHIRQAIYASPSMQDGNNRDVMELQGRAVTIGHTGLQHHTNGHRMPKKTKEHLRGYSSQDMPWGKHWDNKAAAKAAAPAPAPAPAAAPAPAPATAF